MKVLCICENNGLADKYFVKYLKKTNLDVSVATETIFPLIQNYDFAIFFEPGKPNMNRLASYLTFLPKKTKKIFFAQDPHLNLFLHQQIISQLGVDAVITTQKKSVEEFKKMGLPVLYCTWGYDPEVNRSLKLRRYYDIGMAGTVNPYLHPIRCSLLKKLEDNFELFPIAECKDGDVSKVYSSSKIGFNFSIDDDINFRIFEVISSGALLITDDKPMKNGLGELFEPDNEIIVYKADDYEDLKNKVEFYLNNRKKRSEIIRNAKKRIKQYSYKNRAKEIIKFLKRLKKEGGVKN